MHWRHTCPRQLVGFDVEAEISVGVDVVAITGLALVIVTLG